MVSSKRWRFDVISPLTNQIEWTCVCKTAKEVVEKWKIEKNNNFLTKGKITRIQLGAVDNPYIRCYKIGRWAKLDKRFNVKKEEPEIISSVSPTPSIESNLDDYSTCGETDVEDIDEDNIETDVDDYSTCGESDSDSDDSIIASDEKIENIDEKK
jgi:hypothetical protein